jgi:hypothetical protein
MNILPVVKVGAKQYFMDERCKQFRLVANPSQIIEFIAFGSEPWDEVESICFHERFVPQVRCPDCRFQDVFVTEIRDKDDQ